jgi:alcohol dehydrogenase (NADP+)
MLKLAAEKGVKSWIQTIPISEDGCKKGVEGVANNKARYRYVLTDYAVRGIPNRWRMSARYR